MTSVAMAGAKPGGDLVTNRRQCVTYGYFT